MLSQIVAVTLLNIQQLPKRLGTSLIIVVGIACVVGVLISVLAMATGFAETVANTGRDDRALVLRGGSQAELNSTLQRDSVFTISDAPGVKTDENGRAIASAEVMVIINLPRKDDPSEANVALRGVGPQAGQLRPEVEIIEGRMFTPGLREMIVGRGAQVQFAGLDVGERVMTRGSEWTVVGVFESAGDSHESEIMADVATVQSAFRRGNTVQSVVVLLESEADFEEFRESLTTNPTLAVDAIRESDYYASQSEQLSTLMYFVAYAVGGIMALGALFGALATMFTAIEARGVEIATLRALGFGAVPVVISVFAEALLLAVTGAIIGALAAWLFFSGNVVNTLGGNFTQVVFPIAVTPSLALLGIIWAVAIGMLGALFPALRAARLPVAMALQAK